MLEETSNRLNFYKTLKKKHEIEAYLSNTSFVNRKVIAKFRCSDHPLEIEAGRHRNVPRENRTCKFCPLGVLEMEEHFLSTCALFERHKSKHNLKIDDPVKFIVETDPTILGNYLNESLDDRGKFKEWFL